MREILLRPAVLAAVAALIAGQATMVLIMTMTPLHLTEHGHGLDIVGIVISGHVAGMFALAPVSGWIIAAARHAADDLPRDGASSWRPRCSPASRRPRATQILFVALFLLGWGWNLGFVAGSAMLSSEVELAERARVQGVADAVIWTTSALASLGSGAVVAAAGFSTLGFLGVAIVLAPVWLLLNRRRAIAAGAA